MAHSPYLIPQFFPLGSLKTDYFTQPIALYNGIFQVLLTFIWALITAQTFNEINFLKILIKCITLKRDVTWQLFFATETNKNIRMAYTFYFTLVSRLVQNLTKWGLLRSHCVTTSPTPISYFHEIEM